MTDSSHRHDTEGRTAPPSSNGAQAADEVVEEKASSSPAWRRRFLGDIHVGVLAGNARQVPGTGTARGEKAIAKTMADVLDRVRRSIRDRSPASRPAPRPSARA